MKQKKTDIPNWLFVLMCLFIVFAGVASLALPHPSAWLIPDDCELLEGVVVEKRIEDKMCFMGACAGDSILVIEPHDNSTENRDVHVSPIVYHSSPIGSPYAHYLCH